MVVVKNGYICRGDPYYRNWWLIKYNGSTGKTGIVVLGDIRFPLEMVGKRFRLKVEVIENGEEK